MRTTRRVLGRVGVNGRLVTVVAVVACFLLALPKTGLSATAAHDPWKVQEVRAGTPVGDAFGDCQ